MSYSAKRWLVLVGALAFTIGRVMQAGDTGFTWKGQLWNIAVIAFFLWSADQYYKKDKEEKRCERSTK